MKKLGIFGGGFDPPHFGHLNLALQLKEIHGLDEVLFIPAYCSPFKGGSPPRATPQERLKMTKLAIQGIPGFSVCDYEIKKGGPSYTIDTVRYLKKHKKWSKYQFHLLLSQDALSDLDRWKEVDALARLAPPLFGCRTVFLAGKKPKIAKKFLHLFRKGITSTKLMEISSTEVRERLKKGNYCGHLVQAKVLGYIIKNSIYS